LSLSKRTVYLVFIWLAFVLRGLFYSAVVPLWEGYDEWAHFAYVQHIVEHRTLPVVGKTHVSAEVDESLKLAPLPWTLRNFDRPSIVHDDYWRLPEAERQRRHTALNSIPREDATRPASRPTPIYEAHQPPLYYLLVSPVLMASRNATLPTRALLLRWVSILIASTAIPLIFLTAREVLKRDDVAIGVAALAASMSGLTVNIARVGNESLAIPIVSALVLLTVRSSRGTGVALAAALLTKAYSLAFVLPVAAFARKRAAQLAIAAAAAGWWYWRAWSLTGSMSGLTDEAAVRHVSILTMLQRLGEVKWLEALDSTSFAHVWWGNWSFLSVRSWMYHFMRGLAVVSAVGLLVRLVRRRERPLLVLLAFYLCFCAALAYHVVVEYFYVGVSATTGWYLYCLIAAELVLLAAGAAAVVGERWLTHAIGFAVLCFVALDIYTTHFLLIPYYTGFIAHTARGAVAAFHVEQFNAEILDRLLINKPGWLIGPVVATLWSLYIVSTAALLWIARPRRYGSGTNL
jgi:hypothetical protein